MMNSDKITVLLVDDNEDIYKLVYSLIQDTHDITLLSWIKDGRDVLPLCQAKSPDIVLMDVVMPFFDGIEATTLLKKECPQIKIIALSSFHDDFKVYSMLRNGATGYILKNSFIETLLDTIRTTYLGKAVLSEEVATNIFCNLIHKTQKNFNLTDRELEVLRLASEGKSNEEIAQDLFVSRSTIKFHIANILQKMQVKTRAQAIALALRHNLI